jgi:hypothetical protein
MILAVATVNRLPNSTKSGTKVKEEFLSKGFPVEVHLPLGGHCHATIACVLFDASQVRLGSMRDGLAVSNALSRDWMYAMDSHSRSVHKLSS